MTIISGKLWQLDDLHAFIGQRSAGRRGLPNHQVQLIVRRREASQVRLKHGVVLTTTPIVERTYDDKTGQDFSQFSIKVPTHELDDVEDLQLVARDSSGELVYRSERWRPGRIPSQLEDIYVMHDVLGEVDEIRDDIQAMLNVDPFAGVNLPTNFGEHFFHGVAMPSLDAVTEGLVLAIEQGEFPGIGRQEIASTDTDLTISGNTFNIDFEFYKHTNQLVRLNSGGPAMIPKKRFLTLSIQARILVADSVDVDRFADANVMDIDIKSKKALVIIGAPFADKKKLLPAGTADAVASGIDAAVRPVLDSVSAAVSNISNLPLLNGLAPYFSKGITATLTGFDTTPLPGTRGAQLRPIVAFGFPAHPFGD